MTPDELRDRIIIWENLHTEFKQQLYSKEELAKDLVCLANADGGQYVIGVTDDRTIIGVDDHESVFRIIDEVAVERCEPPLTVDQEAVQLDGRTMVVVNVPKGDQRPYRTKSGRFYVRTAYGCRQPSWAQLRRLYQAAQFVIYDETPLTTSDLDDLDLDEAERYVNAQDLGDVDLVRTLRAWGLVHEGHPTVAGMLMFGREPQRVMPAAEAVLLAYGGTDPGEDVVDRYSCSGGLLAVIEQAESFLSRHLRNGRQIRGFEPEAIEEIPTGVLREAVVNALIHRDYTIPGPTRVIVFADRVEVHAPGRPPNSVDVEAMRVGIHVPRNPHVYSRVYAAGMSSGAGSGVPRMARLLREHNGTELGIRVSDAETVLVMQRQGNDDNERLV